MEAAQDRNACDDAARRVGGGDQGGLEAQHRRTPLPLLAKSLPLLPAWRQRRAPLLGSTHLLEGTNKHLN